MQTQLSKRTNVLTTEHIASTAYSLWEQAGHPSARDLDFWLQAERQLTQPDNKKPADLKATQAAPAPTKTVSSLRAQSF